MQIISNKNRTTFGINFEIDEYFEINQKQDCLDFWNKYKDGERCKSFVVFGGGSNMILSDKKSHNVLFIKNKGIEIIHKNISVSGLSGGISGSNDVYLKVAAGDVWQDVVKFALANDLAGIEALSAIPGTTGAAPVQNIGAYGSEVKDVLESVEVFDMESGGFKVLTNTECEFAYRHSTFKKPEHKHRYIIVSIILKLRKSKTNTIPDFKPVRDFFAAKYNLDKDNKSQMDAFETIIREISEVITNIRWSKLPKPDELPNVGSFFHNPIISEVQVEKLKRILPDVPVYPAANGMYKVPAGYLIEQAGLKGYRQGSVGVYDEHALVLVNHQSATFEELEGFISYIQSRVLDLYGVALRPEPEIIG